MEERAGLPQRRRMHTVERLRRSGDLLAIETTHTDPAYYRKPLVTTREVLMPDGTQLNPDMRERGATAP